MRILFITHRLPYAPNRGDRTRAFHLLQVLASRHEVHVVSLVHDDEERQRVRDLTSRFASVRVAKVPMLRNRIAALASLAGRRPLTHVLLASPDLQQAIRESVEQATPDLVVAFCTGIGEAVLRPPLENVPCILDLVDVDSEKWADLANTQSAPMKWIYGREARLLRAFEQTAARRAAIVSVISERECDIAQREIGLSNAVVVPNGVDTARWAPPHDVVKRRRVVFTGVFNYAPNEQGALWFASEVWPLVKRSETDAVLSLVGMNPSRRVLALAQPGSVVVTGAVPDVRPYVWEAAAAVAPLWLARGTQNKVLEALAAGVTCVVTPAVLAGLPPSAQQACVSREDAAGFADAVIGLLQQPADGERQTAACQSVKDLSWEAQLAPFLELVETARRERR